MATDRTRRPHRVSPTVIAIVSGLVAAMVVSFLVAARNGGGAGDREEHRDRTSDQQRAALIAYEEAIQPIVREGGRVVVEGLRPGILTVREGAVSDDQLESMTKAYVNELRILRDELLEVEAPDFLRRAYELFDEAMEGYVETAELLHRAAMARGEERQALVEQVAPSGEATDDTYDAAWNVINEWRRRLGLPVEM